MSSFEQYSLGNVGSGISVTADGSPGAKVGGVTIVWASVPTVAANRTFKDSDLVEAGEKFIRYGTLVCRITAAADATEIGKFAPFDGTGAATSYADDATRAVSLVEGDVFIVNRSVHQDDPKSDHLEVIDEGRVYKRRLLVVGYGDGTGGYPDAATDAADLTALSLTAFPSATLKTALPQVYFVTEG